MKPHPADLARLAWGSVLLCVAAAAAAQPREAPVLLDVQDFNVTGSTLLAPADVKERLATFRRRLSLPELQQAVDAVRELYRQAGYGAVVVYLPEQAPAGGVVTIAVIEGRLATISVLGNERSTETAVREALPALREGATPRVRDLDRQIALANENPARQIAVTLAPGVAAGQVDAVVNVTERAASRWSVGLDNTGNAQTGELRATVGWRHDDVASRGHQFALQAQSSPTRLAEVTVLTASYAVPWPAQSLRLEAYGAYSDVDGGTTATPAGNLSFVGQGRMAGARVTRLLPRLGEADQRMALSLDRRAYRNDCRIAGLPEGACGPAGENVTVSPLTLEYSVQQAGAVSWAGHLAWTGNLDLGGRHAGAADVQAVRPGAPLRYRTWRGGALVSGEPSAGWRVGARLQGQYTQDALVPPEQFGLAGSGMVRGYGEREVVADRGHVLSLEAYGPELLASSASTPAARDSLRAVVFADLGEGANVDGTECRAGQTRCTLSSAGLGLRWMRGAGQLKIDLARAGHDGNRTLAGDWKLHVAASWTFE